MTQTTRTDLLTPGSPAPDFAASLHDGGMVRLSNWRGQKRVILVFYPGDNTPVCTAQLCALRDEWAGLSELDTQVLGINPANTAKHARFATQYKFPFPLVVDDGGNIAALYGCRGWFGMIRRTVYMIDKHGDVAFAQRGNPPFSALRHVLETLAGTAHSGGQG